MSTFWTALFGGTSAAAIVAALVAAYRLWLNRPLFKAQAEELRVAAADQLSDSAAVMVKQALANAESLIKQAVERAERAEQRAEKSAADAELSRREASEARREANEARRDATDVMREFRRLKLAILSPQASLEALREMVSEPGSNGTGSSLVLG